MEGVNTKTGIGFKIIEDSDRPKKRKTLYQQTVHNIWTDLKPLKRTGRCKGFLGFDRRAAVTFGPSTGTVESKLRSNLMKRVPKAPPKKINQINSNKPVRRTEECNSIKKLKCEPCSKEISKAKANRNLATQPQPAERSFNQKLTYTTRSFKSYWKK